MSVNTPSTEITPFVSNIPTVQSPQIDLSGNQPAGPLPGQFGGHKGSGGLAIGDAILKGIIKGHEFKVQKKTAEAQATIAASNAASESAYSKYQDALSQARGDVNDPNAKAAYDAYVGIFSKGKEAISPFVIPEKGAKGGQKSQGTGKDGKKQGHGFMGIKDFFEANPHVIPQIALMTMQPKPQGQSRDNRVADLQEKALGQEVKAGEQNLKIGDQNLALNDQTIKRNQEAQQRAETERKVEESGGIDNVLADKNATPDLKQAASRMKYESLDKESPEGRMKLQLMQDVQSGQSKSWNPQQRMMAGILGAAPPLQQQTITGKNGHQQMVMIDPLTNQPAQGAKPFDLGPPQWAQGFYAKQAADKKELRSAVEGDPAAWGITLTGDKKRDAAVIDAKASELFVKATFGLQTLADQRGHTLYEAQRDNDQIQSLMKSLELNLPAGSKKVSWLDSNPPTLTYPDGKKTTVGPGYMASILNEFMLRPGENAGVYGYRDTPFNPDGKSPEVLDSERKFLYQFVKNHLMTQKGKQAMTSDQADAFLKQIAVGKPISAGMAPPPQAPSQQQQSAGMPPPPQAGQAYAGAWPGAFGRIQAPPQMGQQQPELKLYMIPGVNGPVQLTDEDLQKLRANNIPAEELSPDLMNQFLGK